MLILQFGTLQESELVTLVSEQVEKLQKMALDSPNLSEYDFGGNDIPDDVFDPAMSPGALLALEGEPSNVQQGEDAMAIDPSGQP